MSNNTGEGRELSEQEKLELFQALLSGSDDGPLQPYLAKARWICPSINPFLDLTRVFYAGIPGVVPEDKDDEDLEDKDYTEEEVKAFDAIMNLERGFNAVLSACAGDVRHLLALIAKVSASASGLRSDDTAKLKSAILAYIHEDPKSGSEYAADYDVELLLPSDIKDMRGFKHVDTAAHLCPLRFKAKFDEDAFDFMDRVEDGSIQITEEFFPSFLYEKETVYDKDNEDLGLFRGYLLVRVYRHIFTGPSSAMDAMAKVNKSKARKFKLTEVTGRTIAYTSVQTYIALSSMSQWKSNDNLFSLQGFYDNIVALFERDPQDPWVIDTLQWWNGQVPGLQQVVSKRKKRSSLLGNKIHSNPADRILAQRAQHAITNDQENHQQASHPCASPAQQPSVSHPQTDLGNHHQDQQLPQGRAQGQSSQHPRCHSQPQPHRRAMPLNHNEGDYENLELDPEEAEDQARLREAQKSERQRETEKAPSSPPSGISSSTMRVSTNSPVSETATQDSQAAAKRNHQEFMEDELANLKENSNPEDPNKRRQTAPIKVTKKGRKKK